MNKKIQPHIVLKVYINERCSTFPELGAGGFDLIEDKNEIFYNIFSWYKSIEYIYDFDIISRHLVADIEVNFIKIVINANGG